MSISAPEITLGLGQKRGQVIDRPFLGAYFVAGMCAEEVLSCAEFIIGHGWEQWACIWWQDFARKAKLRATLVLQARAQGAP